MAPETEQLTALAVALGIGLLLGIERERRKSEGPERDAADVRTFALVAFLGSLSTVIPIPGLPILVGLFIGARTQPGRRSGCDHPILLASREKLHQFGSRTL